MNLFFFSFVRNVCITELLVIPLYIFTILWQLFFFFQNKNSLDETCQFEQRFWLKDLIRLTEIVGLSNSSVLALQFSLLPHTKFFFFLNKNEIMVFTPACLFMFLFCFM